MSSISCFAQMYDQAEFSDTIITTKHTTLLAHAAVLAAHSAFFRSMLQVSHAVTESWSSLGATRPVNSCSQSDLPEKHHALPLQCPNQ